MKTIVSAIAPIALASFVLPSPAATLGENTGVNSTLGISPTTKDFVTEAAMTDMFEIESKGGEDAEPKAWAGKTLPYLQGHLTMAQSLDQ